MSLSILHAKIILLQYQYYLLHYIDKKTTAIL